MVECHMAISVQTFLKSFVSILLNLILTFVMIGKLGVETTSFAALQASAGVAIRMALSHNLSNFVGRSDNIRIQDPSRWTITLKTLV